MARLRRLHRIFTAASLSTSRTKHLPQLAIPSFTLPPSVDFSLSRCRTRTHSGLLDNFTTFSLRIWPTLLTVTAPRPCALPVPRPFSVVSIPPLLEREADRLRGKRPRARRCLPPTKVKMKALRWRGRREDMHKHTEREPSHERTK